MDHSRRTHEGASRPPRPAQRARRAGFRRGALAGRRRLPARVPDGAGQAPDRHGVVEAADAGADPGGPTRLPLHLPGLSRRGHEPPARGRAHGPGQGPGSLRSLRPVRAAAKAHERVGDVSGRDRPSVSSNRGTSGTRTRRNRRTLTTNEPDSTLPSDQRHRSQRVSPAEITDGHQRSTDRARRDIDEAANTRRPQRATTRKRPRARSERTLAHDTVGGHEPADPMYLHRG